MKATKIFMMAALALTFAACSNDDNDLAQQPAEQPANDEITITATVSSDDGATTRALSIDGSNIASTWETTDEFAILFNDGSSNVKREATVSSINGSTVTITFTIPSSLANNTACTIVYPASAANAANTGADVAAALATQDGTIGNCPEVRVGTATINKDNHNLTSVTKLAAQNAIFKFTTKNAAGTATINVKPLTVTIGAQDYVITPASATSEFFVALPAVSSQTVSFSATGSDSKTYTCSKDGVTFAAGKYYQSTLKMAAPATGHALSASAVGEIVGSDGKAYAVGDKDNLPTGVTAVAMVAYVGTASDCAHGLAIALADESGKKNYGAAGPACSGKAAVTGGTWRLPSYKDWQYMFIGCGASGSYSADTSSMSYSGLASKLTTAQGDALQADYYWSSTEWGSGYGAVSVSFGGSNAEFIDDSEEENYRVRACLAF